MTYHEKILVNEVNTSFPDVPIHEIISKIDNNGLKCVAIVDQSERLLGIIHDTDLRRALAGEAQKLSTKDLMNQEISFIREDGVSPIATKQVLPVVDNEGRLSHFQYTATEYDLETITKVEKIGVIGLGYVGATLAVTLTNSSFFVVGIEQRIELVNKIKHGDIGFYEDDGDQLLKQALDTGRFEVCQDYSQRDLDIVFITVGTPLDSRGEPNKSYLQNAFSKAVNILRPGGVICLRSTVQVGTCKKLLEENTKTFHELGIHERLYLAMAPERTIEGAAFKELHTNPQLVGTESLVALEKCSNVFERLGIEIISSPRFEEVELAKLVDNTFRDLNFAYANMLALVGHKTGLNATRVIEMVNKNYPRTSVPKPSPGVGGPCLTKDTKILTSSFENFGNTFDILNNARRLNLDILESFLELLLDEIRSFEQEPKRIHILGLAFKGNPRTSDLRDSTSLLAIDFLKDNGVEVLAYDPYVDVSDPLISCPLIDAGQIGVNAQAICILNNNPVFTSLNWSLIATNLSLPILFDGWGVLKRLEIARNFKIYRQLGG